MKLRLVPPRQGALWVRQGFRMLLRQPMGFTALFFLFLFGTFLLLGLPGIGVPALLVLMPAVSLGFMLATETALAGRIPLPSVFVAPFKQERSRVRAQLQLGVAHAVVFALALLLAGWLDGDGLKEMQEAMARGGPVTVDQAALGRGLLVRFGLMLPVTLLFWHAPALIYWGGTGPMQAIFYSAVACWRNKGAFAVYFLCWGGVVVFFTMLLGNLMALFGISPAAAMALMPAAGLFFTAAFYASLFFTFVDCFEPDTRRD